jgi:sterol desaturase/sphingolipid hydroxylase (fatty acid hydroxylase superfamily)
MTRINSGSQQQAIRQGRCMAGDILSKLDAFWQFAYARTLDRMNDMLTWIVHGENRFFWLYLVGMIAVAWVAYAQHYRGRPGVASNLWRFLFSREIYTHPSAIVDYKLLVANQVFGPTSVLVGLFLRGASITVVAGFTQAILHQTFGSAPNPEPIGVMVGVFIFITITLVADFSSYLNHRMQHHWPLLWEFHKLHHSAEVMTPLTYNRRHPVYDLLHRIVEIIVLGPVEGVVLFLFSTMPDPIVLFSGNAIYSVFNLLGSNLRHSHVWFSFGPLLERMIVSPAQHQIHHSKSMRHWNRNYGEVFALWDWMFGTLYVPGKVPEKLEFGIAGAERQEFPTLWAAYTVPLKNAARLLMNGKKSPTRPALRQ